jgi:hypothetical protein
MTRDWAAEWEREQESVDDIVAMFEAYNACEHVWIADKGEHVALSWIDHICVKCGAGKAVVGAENIRLIMGEEPEPLLPDNMKGGAHCL